MDNLEQLSRVMSEDEAREILKLTDNFDKYIRKFKDRLDVLLEPVGYEVKLGILFDKKKE
jgi:oligoribonuclease NrnB/cAMP/cGMP phosphodiesterase (DHH superfamily)